MSVCLNACNDNPNPMLLRPPRSRFPRRHLAFVLYNLLAPATKTPHISTTTTLTPTDNTEDNNTHYRLG